MTRSALVVSILDLGDAAAIAKTRFGFEVTRRDGSTIEITPAELVEILTTGSTRLARYEAVQ